MTHKNSQFPLGDTLIEVIFAFAILGTIVGFAFTGAISARRSAINAQERTQALLIAQYQSQALLTYRDSLPWNSLEGVPNFMGESAGGVDSVSDQITDNPSDSFCMQVDGPEQPTSTWKLIKNNVNNNCNSLASSLTPVNNNTYLVEIKFLKLNDSCITINSCDGVKANIKVQWLDRSNIVSSVSNILILTKSL